MRLLALLAVGGLYGCYSPTLRDCEITCANGAGCPSGFSCEASYCRNGTTNQTCPEVLGDANLGKDGEILDAADPDMDGVTMMDNCPIDPNPDQADEDDDGVGDVCDPCPYLPPIGSASPTDDADGDGVGDLCDPNPSANTERFVAFNAFNAAPAGWMQTGTITTAFAGGAATIDASTGDVAAGVIWRELGLNPQKKYRLVSRITLLAVNSTGSLNNIRGAGLIHYASNSAGRSCMLSDQTGVCAVNISTDGADVTLAGSCSNTPASTNIPYDLVLTRQNNPAWDCAVPPGSSVAGDASTSATLPNVETVIGVRVRAAKATFEFVYVIEVP